jgi:molecular chaperone GrpE (heat shock protein)
MAGKIDPIGGMFKAIFSIKDESSKPLKAISDNIDKAVEGSEKLKDEFKGIEDNIEKLHDKTKDILQKTNDMGVLGATLFGTNGRGDLTKQLKSAKDEMGGFAKVVKGPLTGSVMGLGNALLTTWTAYSLFSDIASGAIIFAALPKLFLDSAAAAATLVTPIEEMRQKIKLTNTDVINLTGDIVEVMGKWGTGVSEVLDVYQQLLSEGRAVNGATKELAKTQVFLQTALQDTGVDLNEFRRVLHDVGQQGPEAMMGIANAMQHVASTTVLSHQAIQGLINTISQSLVWKLPRELRMKAMPQMIADISTIAAEWEKIMGDPTTITQGFDRALDIFDEQGYRLKAMIVGLGGATQDALQTMLDTGDAGGFFAAQVQAVQNLRDQLGDAQFTKLVPMYAEQFGVAREELQRMSQIDLGDLTKKIEKTRKKLVETADVREAWDRALGIFNNIWERINDIGEAFLIGMGRPILRVIVPLIDYFDKFLEGVVNLIGGFSSAVAEGAGLAVMFGALGYASSVLYGVLPLIGEALIWLGGAIATYVLPVVGTLLIELAPFIAIGAAIAGVVYLMAKAWEEWGDSISGVLSIVWDRFVNIAKRVGEIFVLMNPIGIIIAALVTQWDTFVEAMQPGLADIKGVWNSIGDTISDVMGTLKEALGETSAAGEESFSFFEFFAGALKVIAKSIGTVFSVVGTIIAGAMNVVKNVIKIWGKLVEPFYKFFGMLTDAKGRIFEVLFGEKEKKVDLGSAGGTVADLSAVPAFDSGGFTTADTPAMLHANEAVVPLEKMPEFVQQTVTIDQQSVVNEIRKLRETIEMLSRRGGSNNALYMGGGA